MARLRPAAAPVGDLQALNRPRLRHQGARRAGAGNPPVHFLPRSPSNLAGAEIASDDWIVAELVGKITEGRDQTQSRDRGFWFEP